LFILVSIYNGGSRRSERSDSASQLAENWEFVSLGFKINVGNSYEKLTKLLLVDYA